MGDKNMSIVASLDKIQFVEEFEDWVKWELRPKIPHAALLATVGKLYGVGSVPTHRFSVDFPLSMVESLKNSAGALDDPLMYGWFRSEKLRFVEFCDLDQAGPHHQWRRTLGLYGFRSMMIHGVLDHSARRFVVFQMCNPANGGAMDNVRLISSLIEGMSKAIMRIVDARLAHNMRSYIGHPTISLTPTELHIIELLAQGLSNKEIARRRGVSDSTVKTQVQRTGAKLGATRRAEIVAIAMPMLSPLPPQTLLDYGDDENR